MKVRRFTHVHVLTGAGGIAALIAFATLPAAATTTAGTATAGAEGAPAYASVAQTSTGGITVKGTGTAVVVPDLGIIEFNIRSQAKSMLQAMEDFKSKRTLFDKAMADFTEEEVETAPTGIRIGLRSNRNNNFVVMNGEAPPSAPYEARELVNVRVPLAGSTTENLDLLAEIIAAADDVDVRLEGPDGNRYYSSPDQEPSPITFEPSQESIETARSAALQAAYADAVKQAQELAGLSGVRVGSVESISVTKDLSTVAKSAGATERSVTLSVRFSIVQ